MKYNIFAKFSEPEYSQGVVNHIFDNTSYYTLIKLNEYSVWKIKIKEYETPIILAEEFLV